MCTTCLGLCFSLPHQQQRSEVEVPYLLEQMPIAPFDHQLRRSCANDVAYSHSLLPGHQHGDFGHDHYQH